MTGIDNGMRIHPAPWWLGRNEEERARRDTPRLERCANCGAPLGVAYLEAPGGDAVCSQECAS